MWQLDGTCWVFCLWRGCITSTKCTPRRGSASPLATKGILRSCCPLLGIHPASSPEHHQEQTSETSDSAPLFIKTGDIETLSFFPCQWFGEPFSCAVPCAFLLFPSSCFQESASCTNPMGCPLYYPAPQSFCSPHKGLPSLCSTKALLSLSSPLCTMYLLCSLPQIMQIVLLVLRSISSVFKMV